MGEAKLLSDNEIELYRSNFAEKIEPEDAAYYCRTGRKLFGHIDTIKAENTRLKAERDAAVQDLYDTACGLRESPSDTGCCFACKHNDIDECEGVFSNSCFEWRGLEGK